MAHINIRQEKRTSERTRVNKTEHPKRKIFEYNKIHVGTCRERESECEGEADRMYSDSYAVRIGTHISSQIKCIFVHVNGSSSPQ